MAVLDATVGGASANSYLTLAAANALAADDLGPEAERWRDPTVEDDRLEVALKRATRELDDLLRPSSRYATTQWLRFPQATDLDADGNPVIPLAIQHATYYQAAFVLSNASVLDRANSRHARDAQSVSEPNATYQQDSDANSMYSKRALQAIAGFAQTNQQAAGMISVFADLGYAADAETFVL